MTTQLCVALADLAIQMTNWIDPVGYMMDMFGKNPETAAIMMEFLAVLPEELSFNSKIQLDVIFFC